MLNMNAVKSSHNRFILNPLKVEFDCNCRSKADCPLQNKCLTPSIVQKADVTNNSDNERIIYPGVSETPVKETQDITLKKVNTRGIVTQQRYQNMYGN